jgi:hypothetical protein
VRLNEPWKIPGYGSKKKNSCLPQELKPDHHLNELYTDLTNGNNKNTYSISFRTAIFGMKPFICRQIS